MDCERAIEIIERIKSFALFEEEAEEAFDFCIKILRSNKKDCQRCRSDVLEELTREMYNECFNKSHEEDGLQKWDGGCWVRYKLFENVMERLLKE